MGNALLQFFIIFILLFVIAIPLGKYLCFVFSREKTKLDRFFLPFEKVIYRMSGIKNLEETSWKKYTFSLIFVNAALIGISYLILRLQLFLPLNPAKIGNMEQALTFNTVISFMTNTNLQDYSGETGLSILSQMIFVTMMMFTSAATGLAVAIAIIRALAQKGKVVGNFYQDFVRANVRVLLPLSIIVTILLVALGVPQTLDASTIITTLEGKAQTLVLGPVAALESIKHIGTNGGGFFGVNSAHPFENPNVLSNIIEILSMMALPAALPFTYGLMVRNRKQGRILFGTVFIILIVMLGVQYVAEQAGNPALNKLGYSATQGSMEGKEVRFGIPMTSLFTTVTTAFTTGSVNNMHDTLTPIGGMVPLSLMMLNNIFGGKGLGFVNILMYAMLAVFLAGLMVGRTPEFLGRKIEPREMKLIVIALLFHPLLILVPSAIAFLTPLGYDAISNPGFHGISQVVYQYTTSAANNGSGFEGLGDNTPFWNISAGIVMILGRYISMIAMFAVASSLMKKQPVPESIGTFRTDNTTFGVILAGTILIIGALTFFPVLVLGPIAEFLSIR
jgi:potassium-transporting ATPase potassium-binding subunit